MVFDTIEKLDQYAALSTNLNKAIKYIKQTNLNELTLGKHEVITDEVFVIVSEYKTKDADVCKPEAHIGYIDIQVLLSGEELIGYAPLKKQKVDVAYNADNDVVFYKSKTNKLKILPGEFAIFFPHDIHQPGVKVNEEQMVKKAVVKVKVQ